MYEIQTKCFVYSYCWKVITLPGINFPTKIFDCGGGNYIGNEYIELSCLIRALVTRGTYSRWATPQGKQITQIQVWIRHLEAYSKEITITIWQYEAISSRYEWQRCEIISSCISRNTIQLLHSHARWFHWCFNNRLCILSYYTWYK